MFDTQVVPMKSVPRKFILRFIQSDSFTSIQIHIHVRDSNLNCLNGKTLSHSLSCLQDLTANVQAESLLYHVGDRDQKNGM